MDTQDERRHFPRANLQWYVAVLGPREIMEGITKDLSPIGAYIRCARPLKLNEVCDMTIATPDRSLQARAEVVWSNRYGPDDDITPRGMGVRFLQISGDDRRFIAKEVMKHGKYDEISPEYLQTLETEGNRK